MRGKLLKLAARNGSLSNCLALLPGILKLYLDPFLFAFDLVIVLFLVIVFFMHRNYNGEFDRLKADLRQLHAGEKELISYKTTLLILFWQVYSSTCFVED